MTPKYKIYKPALARIDDIYDYTSKQWGEQQAQSYIIGLYETFEKVNKGEAQSRKIDNINGIDGYMTRYEKHFIYWRKGPDGSARICSVLHQSMDIRNRLEEDYSRIFG